MINISLSLRNPFSDRFDVIKSWNGSSPFKHKHWECQIDKTADIVSFDFRYTIRQDHAGLFFCLGLFGYEIIFNYYDQRHWNRETDSWEVYEKDIVL